MPWWSMGRGQRWNSDILYLVMLLFFTSGFSTRRAGCRFFLIYIHASIYAYIYLYIIYIKYIYIYVFPAFTGRSRMFHISLDFLRCFFSVYQGRSQIKSPFGRISCVVCFYFEHLKQLQVLQLTLAETKSPSPENQRVGRCNFFLSWPIFRCSASCREG